MIITNSPIGRMNADDSYYRIPKGEVPYRLNQRVGFGNGANIGVSENLRGNIQVSSPTLPSGTNTCIGSYVYEKAKKIYYFLHNSNGFHTIYEYDYLNDVTTKVLQDLTDTDGVAVLNFSLLKRINHINILDGDEYLELMETLFTLNVISDDLPNVSAEILSTGDILTEATSVHTTVSTSVELTLTTNIVRVTMELNGTVTDSAYMTVNGETRTIPTLSLINWVEDFIVVGIGDITVTVSSGVAVIPDTPTGTWTFTNTTAVFPVSIDNVYLNSSAITGLSPHELPATSAETLSATPPLGVSIIAGDNNISFETTTSGDVALVRMFINLVEIGSQLIGDVTSGSFITPLLADDDVTIQVDSPTTLASGIWTFTNNHPSFTLDAVKVNNVTLNPLSTSPDTLPLSSGETGSVSSPPVGMFSNYDNLIKVTTNDTTGNGVLDVSINGSPTAQYVTEPDGITNIVLTLNAGDSVQITYNSL